MTSPSGHLDLAEDFAPATRDQWRALVGAVLAKSGAAKDVDPEQALTSTTYEGIQVRPLYTAADAPYPLEALGGPGAFPFVRGRSTPSERAGQWDVRQRHAGPDASALNRAILTDLQNGATSIWVAIGGDSVPVADLARVLDGVYLEFAAVALDAGAEVSAATDALLDLVAARGLDPTAVTGTLGADPIAHANRSGDHADVESVVSLASRIVDFPRLQAITVDGSAYHDAGGSDADELAAATSAGVAYLRALTDAGWTIDDALDRIEFRFAVTDNQFASIAKLRAARRIWARVAELSDATGAHGGQRQHAVTSAAMMTRRDPWVNMLRTTVACFAAAVGGADAITVAPFDAALGASDDFSRRIARNTQSVLHDEASLGRVSDPAGGSWYVESLTEQLARAAWERFQLLESAGGAADLGAVAALVAPARDRRADDIAHRRFPITGVTQFPELDERRSVSTTGEPSRTGLRYAAAFEALRDRADAIRPRPAVLLAALGSPADYGARVSWATNLFQAGGLRPVVYDGPLDGLAAAFTASGARSACLCSSDRIYTEQAAPVAAALKSAGARTIWSAGRPGDRASSDAAAGIDGYVFDGSDALATLTRAVQNSEAPA